MSAAPALRAVPRTAPPVTDPARTRLELLLDAGTFRPWRSAVGDGVAAGSGLIGGRLAFAWAQDGALPRRLARSRRRGDDRPHHRARRRAGAPVVGFPHSGGARLQEGVAALTAYAAIFAAQTHARVPQISVVAGPCAGGAAYSTALGDLTIMAGPDARLFLTGPRVVERVTRERIDADALGGPGVHRHNGVAHLSRPMTPARPRSRAPRSRTCPVAPARGCRRARPARPLPATRPSRSRRPAPRLRRPRRRRAARRRRRAARARAPLGAQPRRRLRPDRRDAGGRDRQPAAPPRRLPRRRRLREGHVVRGHLRPLRPAARRARRTRPDSFRVQARSALAVIRHGASLLAAFSRATVPRVTVTLRQAFGGAHIVMNSRDLGADLTLAWPDAGIGVMGARQAVELVERRALAAGADPDAARRALRGRAPAGRNRRGGRFRRRGRRARRNAGPRGRGAGARR